jgi:putative colanic acid biosynthesis glycosyltransferase WcaI
MRILIHGINFHPELAGTGKYTGEMASWLAARGHEIRVVTAPPHYPQWKISPGYSGWKYTCERSLGQHGSEGLHRWRPSPEPDLIVFRCPTWVPRNPNGLMRLLHLASFGLSSWPAILWQLTWQPDLVLVVEPTLFCSLQSLLLARCSGAKAWLHVQDFEVDAAFELGDLASSQVKAWAIALERKLLRRFDRVSTISNRMIERLMSKGVEPSRCVFFPNWVDTNVILPLAHASPLRRELGIASNTIVALFSGSMGKKHGLDLLLTTVRQLSHRTDLRFVICGDGPCRNTLADEAKDLSNVHILPFQPAERLNDLLNLADIHLLPQRADVADLVMPSKLTGMLASGRPVIATAASGTQLASAVHGRGLVVPPGDSKAFTAAINQLVENADLRSRLGFEARRYALAHLEFEVVLRRVEASMLLACQCRRRTVKLRAGEGSSNSVSSTQ